MLKCEGTGEGETLSKRADNGMEGGKETKEGESKLDSGKMPRREELIERHKNARKSARKGRETKRRGRN